MECPDGVGTLLLGRHRYDIPVPWGQLVKVTAYGNAAMYPEKDENEVISINESVARVQGVGVSKFILLKDGVAKEITVDFSESAAQEIRL